MVEFLKIQFRLNRVTQETLRQFVGKWLTKKQFVEITGQSYA